MKKEQVEKDAVMNVEQAQKLKTDTRDKTVVEIEMLRTETKDKFET